MKSDKNQTLSMIGISLMVIGIAIIFIGVSQPRIYVSDTAGEVVSSTVAGDLSSVLQTTVNQVTNSPTNAATTQLSVSYPLNLNTATMEELMTIEGIGETKAYAIVCYRQDIGPFTSVNDLLNISGIGEATLQKIAPYLTV